ncbi:hypothetical protein [Actinacidiphila sp. bgisy145]|uniref:hypothetical protein n=1 Tax=Actinacidiphila sp. bgisy145 TaxID=3413792 RepID=UPI003EBB71EB
MDEHDNDALHAAFEAVLRSQPEPPLPSVTDAAIAGGRRIRRRRAALAAVSTLAVASTALTVFGLTRTGGGPTTPPLAPIGTTGSTAPAPPPPSTATAPKNPGGAFPFHSAAAGATPEHSADDPRGAVRVSGGQSPPARRVSPN